MTFAEPIWLAPLALLPVLLLLGTLSIGRARRERARFAARLERPVGRPRLRLLGEAAALSLIVLALAGPEATSDRNGGETVPCDIMIALDRSASMAAGDTEPSRAARARREVKSLLAREGGGVRFGLVRFSGAAELACPLTHDRETVAELLDGDAARAPGPGGSNLGAGLALACRSFDREGPAPRAVIVVTDGEERGDPADLAAATAAARNAGIPVFFLLVGTSEGARIPLQEGGFLRDEASEEVLTRCRFEPARSVAGSTGGDCLATAETTFAMDALRAGLNDAFGRADPLGPPGGERALFQWFLLAAGAIAAGLYFAPRLGAGRAGAGALLLLLCAGCAGCGESALDAAREGNRLYGAGEFRAAADAYRRGLALSRDGGVPDEQRRAIAVNLGQAHYRMGEYGKAISRMYQGFAIGRGTSDPAVYFLNGLCRYRLAEEVHRGGEAGDERLREACRRALEAATDFAAAASWGESHRPAALHNEALARSLAGELKKTLEARQAAKDKEDAAGGDAAGGDAAGGDAAGGDAAGGDAREGDGTDGEGAARSKRGMATEGWVDDPGPLTPEEARRIFTRLDELKKKRREREDARAAETPEKEIDW